MICERKKESHELKLYITNFLASENNIILYEPLTSYSITKRTIKIYWQYVKPGKL
jgi:hypothetical protein